MKLNLPAYNFQLRETNNGTREIFDPFRKKWIVKTPEEEVRQYFIKFLVEEKQYPVSLIGIEKGLTVNNMKKRFDAVVYGSKGEPLALLEFKAPSVKISQKVFDQAGNYNKVLNVAYLIVSNGISHYCCKLDQQLGKWVFLKSIPAYQDLL